MPIIPLMSVELDDDESPEGIDMPLISIAFGNDVFVLLVNSLCSKVVCRGFLREKSSAAKAVDAWRLLYSESHNPKCLF